MAPDAATMRMDPTRERALVARARVDASAFGELYDFYLPRIYAFIVRRVRERAVAEDLTATTFERGLTVLRGGQFRNESFGGWLYRVASNAIVDQARRDRRAVPLGTRASDSDPEGGRDGGSIGDDRALEAFTAALERDSLARALQSLPEQHRRIIVMRFFDELGSGEMCAALGCSPGTLAVKLHRALRALRGAMAAESIDAA
jgi:RNA polymerase sigma-70 factor (ECF subfamily)